MLHILDNPSSFFGSPNLEYFQFLTHLATCTSPGDATEAGRELIVMSSRLSSRNTGSWMETSSTLRFQYSLEPNPPRPMSSLLLLVLHLGFDCLLRASTFLVMYPFLKVGKLGWPSIAAGFRCRSCWLNPSARILFRSRDVLASNHAAAFMPAGGLQGSYFTGLEAAMSGA